MNSSAEMVIGFLLAVVPIVLVSEAYLIGFDVEQAVVRDRNAMGVAADIIQHLFGAGEGTLGIDNPLCLFQRLKVTDKCAPILRLSKAVKNRSLPESKAFWSCSRNRRRNSSDNTRTCRKKPGLQGIQRAPSGEMPPPGTTQCKCG